MAADALVRAALGEDVDESVTAPIEPITRTTRRLTQGGVLAIGGGVAAGLLVLFLVQPKE